MTDEKKITTILACSAEPGNELYIPRDDIAKLLEAEEVEFFKVHAEFDYFHTDADGKMIIEEVLGNVKMPKVTRITDSIIRFKIGVIADET